MTRHHPLLANLLIATVVSASAALAEAPNLKVQYQAIEQQAAPIVDDMQPFGELAGKAFAGTVNKDTCLAVAITADGSARLLPLLSQQMVLNKQGHFRSEASMQATFDAITQQRNMTAEWVSAHCPSQEAAIKRHSELRTKYEALYQALGSYQPQLMALITKTKPVLEGQTSPTACADMGAYATMLTKTHTDYVQLAKYNAEGRLGHDEEMNAAPTGIADILDKVRSWQRGNCR